MLFLTGWSLGFKEKCTWLVNPNPLVSRPSRAAARWLRHTPALRVLDEHPGFWKRGKHWHIANGELTVSRHREAVWISHCVVWQVCYTSHWRGCIARFASQWKPGSVNMKVHLYRRCKPGSSSFSFPLHLWAHLIKGRMWAVRFFTGDALGSAAYKLRLNEEFQSTVSFFRWPQIQSEKVT